jgi:hypothetical protein
MASRTQFCWHYSLSQASRTATISPISQSRLVMLAAVELAKLALWLETVAADVPLTFLDHHSPPVRPAQNQRHVLQLAHSDDADHPFRGSRSVIPIDPDQGGGVSAPLDAFLISVFSPDVKHGGARLRSQQEGPARDAE